MSNEKSTICGNNDNINTIYCIGKKKLNIINKLKSKDSYCI